MPLPSFQSESNPCTQQKKLDPQPTVGMARVVQVATLATVVQRRMNWNIGSKQQGTEQDFAARQFIRIKIHILLFQIHVWSQASEGQPEAPPNGSSHQKAHLGVAEWY